MVALNSMIDLAISQAEFEHGRKLVRRNVPATALAGVKISKTAPKSPKWSAEEDKFLCATLGLLTEDDIASELGRTVTGVHLRWKRDLHLQAPSKRPAVITANRAALALGIDGHKVAFWMDAGMIPGRLMAGKRRIRLIERVTFLRWACAPVNWVYFDPKKVADPKLKRLLQLEAQRWGDEWWSTRRAADYHGTISKTILLQIQMGRLPGAIHLAFSRCGRHPHPAWSYWFVLRSQVKTLVIPRGKGCPGISKKFSKAADAWILKARDQLGMTFIAIGRTMKIGNWNNLNRTNAAVFYRYHQLKKQQKNRSKRS